MMTKEIMKMKNLINWLNHHTALYDAGVPEVEDTVWDREYFKLVELEKETNTVFPNSPTQTINYELKTNLNKVEHNHFMGSAAKTKDWYEFLRYFDCYDVTGMLKLDGLTLSLRYVDGELVSAETRGNGEVGEDVTHNARVIKSIPKHISYKDELVIDGECICTYKNFEPFKEEYANPRNFASGSIRLLDSAECAKRNLTFVAWNVVKGLTNNVISNFNKLEKLGFTITPWTSSFDWDAKDFLVDNAKELGYPIDGLIGRFTDITYGESLGSTGHHSRAIYAFKFADDEYETELVGIDYDVSRTGVLTPVAVFEPVDTGDSIVARASLHNLSVMEELLGTYPEQRQSITIIKANEIIPKVVRAIKNNIPHDHILNAIPDYCPICFEDVEIQTSENGIKNLVCTNPCCKGKLSERIVHFADRKKGIDIRGLSEQTIDRLIEWGWVNELSDIFNLSTKAGEWKNKPGFGKESVDNILSAIESSKRCKTEQFISGIGIPLIGLNAAKALMKEFIDWNDFRECGVNNSKYTFENIEGFGEEMNRALKDFDYAEADKIAALLDFEPNIPKKVNKNGLVFCITGALSRNRDEIVVDIEAAGGKVASSVSKKTSYLVCNSIENTSKYNKALELNIPIINEEEMIDILESL